MTFLYKPEGTARLTTIWPILSNAELLHRQNAQFRNRCLVDAPRHAAAHIRRVAAQLDSVDYREANGYVRASAEAFKAARVSLAFDDDEIEARAQSAAHVCRRFRRPEGAFTFATSLGFKVPKGRKITPRSAWERLKDPTWWRAQYGKKLPRSAENAFRQIGQVHRKAAVYVTDDGLERFKQRQRKSAEFIERCDLVHAETGELFPFADVAARSLSNPAIRRGELMTRAKGFEVQAAKRGDTWIHVTLTAPSAFHAFKDDGSRNPRWIGPEGGTVRHAQAWLQKRWELSRSKLKRLSILYYGFRTAEPHHDATPHWHMVIHGTRAALETVAQVLRGYWLAQYADEPGAAEHRVKVGWETPGRGTATAYISKYIAKGVDGHALETDDPRESDLSGKDASVRVVAWARIHGIRQFQQMGGPAVGNWRELRRIREAVPCETIERARLATNKPASWSDFIDAQGGLETCRSAPRVALDMDAPRCVDRQGRRVLKVTRYGELPPDRPVGVKCIEGARIKRASSNRGAWTRVLRVESENSSLMSRLHSDLGPVAITVRDDAPSLSDPAGWTSRETSMAGPH